MEKKRILELALETLQAQKAVLDSQIDDIRAELAGRASTPTVVEPVQPGRRRKRSSAERLAQSQAMKLYWKKRKAGTAKMETPKKPAPEKKTGPQSAAARKAISERMRAYWKKRKAAQATAKSKA